MGIGGSGGGFQLILGGVALAEPEVVGDGAMKQVGVLGDDRDLLPDSFEGKVFQVLSAEKDPALLRIEKAI